MESSVFVVEVGIVWTSVALNYSLQQYCEQYISLQYTFKYDAIALKDFMSFIWPTIHYHICSR